MIDLRERYETMASEQLKGIMEHTLSFLGASAAGRMAIETYAFGLSGFIEDPRLYTIVGGVALDNPVMVAAGWDKRGGAVRGLHHLGFAGTELGTIPAFGQPGKERPRMWTINDDHSVGLNRMGFNAIGAEATERKIKKHDSIPGVLGINIGKNKDLLDIHSPDYHALVIERFNETASYFVFNPSSPNTEKLQLLQKKEPMRDHMQAIMAVAKQPVFVKFSPDIPYKDFDESVEVIIDEAGAGLVIANTSTKRELKAKYGDRWADEDGGISGDDPEYRAMTTALQRHAYEEYGDLLDLFGVGGVKDTATALEKIRNGASAVQVMTAIRPSLGRVAVQINRGLIKYMEKEGISNIQDIIGADTKRGVKQKVA
jgi:dihydroorotate dehydrogenase